MNRGSCLCGDITWEIEGRPFMMSNCHCSMCRKLHGGAYGTYVGVLVENFRWTSGEGHIRFYESSPGAQRPFCPTCGSIVAAPMRDGQSVFMPAGNMEGDLDCRLDSHIFAGSRAPWFEITDAAEQHEAYPDSVEQPPVDNPERLPESPGAISGSCLCNAVAYEFDEPLERFGYCHCSRCRKSRSAAHSAQLFVDPAKFRWLRGEDHVTEFKLPGTASFFTSFCDVCGSMLPTVFEGMSMVMVPAGSLDQDPGVRPQAHIYVGSKASWYEITDALPTFEAMPDL